MQIKAVVPMGSWNILTLISWNLPSCHNRSNWAQSSVLLHHPEVNGMIWKIALMWKFYEGWFYNSLIWPKQFFSDSSGIHFIKLQNRIILCLLLVLRSCLDKLGAIYLQMKEWCLLHHKKVEFWSCLVFCLLYHNGRSLEDLCIVVDFVAVFRGHYEYRALHRLLHPLLWLIRLMQIQQTPGISKKDGIDTASIQRKGIDCKERLLERKKKRGKEIEWERHNVKDAVKTVTSMKKVKGHKLFTVSLNIRNQECQTVEVIFAVGYLSCGTPSQRMLQILKMYMD